jgi:hypothetical protein
MDGLIPVKQELALEPRDTGSALKIETSILDQARKDNYEAITTMFKQFLSPDEVVNFTEYCGFLGFWGVGTHCFACLTDRRIASLRVAAFGKILYQDGYLEYTNSGVIYQPSKFWLYLTAFLGFLVAAITVVATFAVSLEVRQQIGGVVGSVAMVLIDTLAVLIAICILPLCIKLYYSFNKCGLVWVIKEGISVYIFTNRSKLTKANRLYRLCTQLRDQRVKAFGHG